MTYDCTNIISQKKNAGWCEILSHISRESTNVRTIVNIFVLIKISLVMHQEKKTCSYLSVVNIDGVLGVIL
jgi:hypothetical protein